MQLYSFVYLFFFLPVFMGLYKLTPARYRKWLIAAANLFFIAANGVKGLAVYGVCLAAAFFSGRVISRQQHDPSGISRCRALICANSLLNAVLFLFFSQGRGLSGSITALDTLSVAGGGVISLHFVSYLVDVYHGCKPADIGTLTAYSSFFPLMSTGPVLRYRRATECFECPELNIRHLGKGIRLYVFGLAEYLIIACRLSSIWQEITQTAVKSRGGAAAWLSLLVWYGAFISAVTSLLIMGQGTALMLGIHVRQPFRRRIFADTVYSRLVGISVHLTMWIKDYIVLPIKQAFGKRYLAAFAGVLFGMMWFCFGAGGLVAGVTAGLALVLQIKLTSAEKASKFVIGVVFTKFATAITAACLAVFALRPYGLPSFKPDFADGGSEVFSYMISSAWLPLLAALFVNGSVLPTALRRMNTRWLSFIMPVIELILLVLCAAYMINNSI